jgi:hypothetical protein
MGNPEEPRGLKDHLLTIFLKGGCAMKRRQGVWRWRAVREIGLILMLVLLSCAGVQAHFEDYQNYAAPGDQMYVVLPEVTGGYFDAIDYFPDNGANNKIGPYETRGRALVANDKYIYLQKNYGAGAGAGSWSPGSDHGYPGDGPFGQGNMPGGHDNWIIVARVTPGVGYPPGNGSMDPAFIHISPDGLKVALGLGYAQPMLVFPISVLNPENPPLLNSGSGGNTPGASVTLFPWGDSPADGVQYYDAEWVPDPEAPLATLPEGKLDPAAASNNTHLAINTDRGWDSDDQQGSGSVIEVLSTTSAGNRPTPTIVNIGYAPNYSASAAVTVDLYGNLITGQGFDYNNPTDGETGQIKIFAANDWMDAYSGGAIEYDHTTNIIADKVLSAATLGVDKDNNLHVGGGDVVGPDQGEKGFAAVIHAHVLERALDDGGAVDEHDNLEYRELQPDGNGDDSGTFAVYNPWGDGIVIQWNPRNFSGTGFGPYDGWYPGVQPIATTYYAEALDQDGDGIPDASDNAYMTYNPGQEDTDGDGWANAADADYDNDGQVLLNDYNTLRNAYNTENANIDMTGDGKVFLDDYSWFRTRYGRTEPFY